MTVDPAEGLTTGMALKAPLGPAYRQLDGGVTEFQFKRGSWGESKYTIRTSQGVPLFVDVKGSTLFLLPTRVVLYGLSGNVLVLLKRKMWTFRSIWSAYFGGDDSKSNLLFTQSKKCFCDGPSTAFDIFLPRNHTSKSDFTVRWNRSGREYTLLFNGEEVAKAEQKGKARPGKYAYRKSIQPAKESLFVASIVALIAFVKHDHART